MHALSKWFATTSPAGVINLTELGKALTNASVIAALVALLQAVGTALIGGASSIFPQSAIAGFVTLLLTWGLNSLGHLFSGPTPPTPPVTQGP